ncbi:uncharacterized protein METZ01_LOCUS492959, partial [marine metagenome]
MLFFFVFTKRGAIKDLSIFNELQVGHFKYFDFFNFSNS